MWVHVCVQPMYLHAFMRVCVMSKETGCVFLSWIKMFSYKTADLPQPWREQELSSFVDFHWNKPAHQRKLFKTPQEWQMCSTMGQMSDVCRIVRVFSKYSGITTVYRYNPLVTWNGKDNTKALMPCSTHVWPNCPVKAGIPPHIWGQSLSCKRQPRRDDVVFRFLYSCFIMWSRAVWESLGDVLKGRLIWLS